VGSARGPPAGVASGQLRPRPRDPGVEDDSWVLEAQRRDDVSPAEHAAPVVVEVATRAGFRSINVRFAPERYTSARTGLGGRLPDLAGGHAGRVLSRTCSLGCG